MSTNVCCGFTCGCAVAVERLRFLRIRLRLERVLFLRFLRDTLRFLRFDLDTFLCVTFAVLFKDTERFLLRLRRLALELVRLTVLAVLFKDTDLLRRLLRLDFRRLRDLDTFRCATLAVLVALRTEVDRRLVPVIDLERLRVDFTALATDALLRR